MTIWLTSDTHFFHNKDFIYRPRGVTSMEEMNKKIITHWNEVVAPDDVIYHLGDVMMGADIEAGLDILRQLNGKKYLAYGNHDTDARLEAFQKSGLFEDIQMGYRLKDGKKTIILTHYPTFTGNYDSSKTYNLHGHTHQLNNFNSFDCCYHVGVDSHDCYPVRLTDAIEEIEEMKIKRRNEYEQVILF